MDKVEELNKASHVLLDVEVNLRTVIVQRQQIEKEIAILTAVEANLLENIRILKRKYAIVIVTEYKKAVLDLSTARNRRAFLRIDKDSCLRAEKNFEAAYEKARSNYERIFNFIHNPPNNVIEVNFGSTSGQK